MRRGARTAMVVSCLGLVTIAVTAYSVRFDLLEMYYRHQLRSAGEAGRIAAVEGLARLDRPGAISPLLGALEEDPSRQVQKASLGALSRMSLGADEERVLECLAARILRRDAVDPAGQDGTAGGSLSVEVRRSESSFEVVIIAGSSVMAGRVREVFTACQELGIEKVSVRARREQGR